MKKILTVIAVSLTSITGFSQVASRILSTQSVPQPISAPNFVWVDNSAGAMNRLWVASADSLKIQPFQLTWFNDSVINKTSSLYKPLNWFPIWTEVTGKPTFSTVATTGQYNDLLGKPTLFSGSYLDLTNKPSVFPTDITNVSGLTTALNNKITVGSFIPYSTITGTPTLATVATTGNYVDLINKPSIPASQVNSDWNSVSGVSQILNKPTIPTNTNQLTNGANFITANGAPVQSVNGQTGTVTLTIPAAQIQSDWTQSNNASLDFIKNKPILGTAASTNSSDYATAAQGTLAATAIQPGVLTSTLSNYVTNTSLSTTLGNYVTSSALTSALGGYATTTALSSGLSGKENTITAGTTSQYWRGDKTWQTLNSTVVPEGTNLYYTDIRARASNSAGTGISYNSTTGVITNSAPDQNVTLNSGTGISVTGTYPTFTVSSTITSPTINSGVFRTTNSNYTISTTQMATVNYSINITVTNPLLIGTSTGTAFLEYSTNGGSTWTTISQISNSSGVGITVTLALTTGGSMILSGTIPANALTRIRTTTSGTASVTYITGQETLN